MLKALFIGALLPFAALGALVFVFGHGGSAALAPLGLIAGILMFRRPRR